MLSAQSDGRLFGALVAGLALVAWAALAVAGSGSSLQSLDHHSLAATNAEGGLGLLGPAGLFLVAWTLMTAAMMLPTTLPLVVLFGRVTGRRSNRLALLLVLLAGYLAVWVAFGALAYGADLVIHHVVESNRWLHANSWLLVALPVLGAGVYQFTPLKYLCLDACRSPYNFILGHWHGNNAGIDSLRLGMSHGLFCLGCCWTLMLLMFALGVGSILWMIAIAIFMGVEKNFAWGSRFSAPLGVILATAGGTVFMLNL